MSVNLASFLYLVSGVLFIMALRGLSHPTTSRQGNLYGMVGMTIAIVTTLALIQSSDSTVTWILFGERLRAFLRATGFEHRLGIILAGLMGIAIVLFLFS